MLPDAVCKSRATLHRSLNQLAQYMLSNASHHHMCQTRPQQHSSPATMGSKRRAHDRIQYVQHCPRCGRSLGVLAAGGFFPLVTSHARTEQSSFAYLSCVTSLCGSPPLLLRRTLPKLVLRPQVTLQGGSPLLAKWQQASVIAAPPRVHTCAVTRTRTRTRPQS